MFAHLHRDRPLRPPPRFETGNRPPGEERLQRRRESRTHRVLWRSGRRCTRPTPHAPRRRSPPASCGHPEPDPGGRTPPIPGCA